MAHETFATAAKERLCAHIHVCASRLMSELINNAEYFSEWEDELYSAASIESVAEGQYRIDEGDEPEMVDQEVYEHWIVSRDAKRDLESVGERVVEIMNLNIWCRTCTGQSFWRDSCMQQLGARYLNQ